MSTQGVEPHEREFQFVIGDEERIFKVVKPTFDVGNKARLYYSKAFADALDMGLKTSFQMKDTTDKSEYYRDIFNDINKIEKEIDENLKQLRNTEDKEEATPLILEIKRLRASRTLEVFKANSIYSNTAESYAEQCQNQFFTSAIVLDDKGNRVWKDFEQFKNEIQTPFAQEAINQVMMFNANLAANYNMEYEENQWLLENGIINENGEKIEDEETTEPVEALEE